MMQAGPLGRSERSVSMPQLASSGELDLEDGRSTPLAAAKPSPLATKTALAKAFVIKWARPMMTVAALYMCLLGGLLVLARRLPTRGALQAKAHLQEGDALLMKLPRNLDELREVRHTLELYRATYSMQVASLLVATYLVLQALSIPGTLCINLLIGSMYSFPLAMGTVALVSTAGACLNYELSARLVRDMVVDLMPGKLSVFHRSVTKHQDNLLSYFIFLRVTPLLPSWFINFASPIVNIPFRTFAIGTLIGLQPLNFITVSAGRTLGRLQSYSDLYGPRTILTMAGCAAVALLPVLLKRLFISRRPGGGGAVER